MYTDKKRSTFQETFLVSIVLIIYQVGHI